jgi:hypothetical protein
MEQPLALAPWGCSTEQTEAELAAIRHSVARGTPVWRPMVDSAGRQTAGPGINSPASRATEKARKRFLTPFPPPDTFPTLVADVPLAGLSLQPEIVAAGHFQSLHRRPMKCSFRPW